ncbi:MAG: secretin N-terminal domain-containing protein, partial [Geminicoccaceae bacterium]
MSAELRRIDGVTGLVLAGLVAGCVADKPPLSGPIRTDRELVLTPATKVADEPGGPRTLFDDETDETTVASLTSPLVELGTGQVIGNPKSLARTAIRQNESGDITLNVIDAEIRDVIRLVLEDALGVNYTIDPTVTGTITVRTSKPIPAKDAIATLGSILSLNGVALVDADGLYKVVPMDQAATAGGRPLGRTSARLRGAGSGVQVSPLHYADAIQLSEMLQPFIAGKGSIQVDAARNTLLLVGSPNQITTMTDLIDMFDVDWMSGMSFGLYPLEAVGPTQLVEELNQILGDPKVGVLAGGLRLVPLDRLSALMVIATQVKSLRRIETWIDRLDKHGDGEGDQVYVYEVQNGRAADLASVLGELFDIRSTSFGEESLLAPGLEPIELRSSLPTFGRGGGVDQGAGSDSEKRESPKETGSSLGSAGLASGRQLLTQGREGSETR